MKPSDFRSPTVRIDRLLLAVFSSHSRREVAEIPGCKVILRSAPQSHTPSQVRWSSRSLTTQLLPSPLWEASRPAKLPISRLVACGPVTRAPTYRRGHCCSRRKARYWLRGLAWPGGTFTRRTTVPSFSSSSVPPLGLACPGHTPRGTGRRGRHADPRGPASLPQADEVIVWSELGEVVPRRAASACSSRHQARQTRARWFGSRFPTARSMGVTSGIIGLLVFASTSPPSGASSSAARSTSGGTPEHRCAPCVRTQPLPAVGKLGERSYARASAPLPCAAPSSLDQRLLIHVDIRAAALDQPARTWLIRTLFSSGTALEILPMRLR